MAAFARLLVSGRRRLGLSRAAAARRAGVDPAYLLRCERDAARCTPSRSVVEALATALELPPDERDRLLILAGYAPRALMLAAESAEADAVAWV